MQPIKKSTSPSPWGAKVTGGSNQAAQLPSMNEGAVSSMAPPSKKGVSSADRLALPLSLKQFAATLKQKNFFGSNDFDTIMNNADDVAQLKKWMTDISALYTDYVEKNKKSQFPDMNKTIRDAQARDTSDAKLALESKIQECLTYVSGVQNNASSWSGGSASTVGVQQTVALPVAAAAVIPTLPGTADFSFDYNNHGDFITKSGNGNIRKGELLSFIRNNLDEFVFKKAKSDAQSHSFTLGLGLARKDHWGNLKEWAITIRYFPDTNKALITHFGPFGDETASKVN